MRLQHFVVPLVRHRRHRRSGTIIVLAAFLMVVLIAAAAFTIDLAYMNLARADLQHATDSAARAASNALGDGASLEQARAVAIDLANDNRVVGKRLELEDEDIEFGQSVLAVDGSFTFNLNATPINAVRITGQRTQGSTNGPVTLWLGHMLGKRYYEPTIQAAAARVDRDICIVVDRSGSMAWDLSDQDWSYPPPLDQNEWEENYITPPHATDSRWAALVNAVQLFVAAMNDTPEEELLALVSYSNEYEFEGVEAETSTIHSELTSDHTGISETIGNIGDEPIIGGTNISAGLNDGIDVLTNVDTIRAHAFKVMVLMTDGQWNAGADPVTFADEAAEAGIVVHTITFSAGANQDDMEEVANATGGRFYHAPNAAALNAAFADIAYSVPVLLIQ